MDSIPAHRAAAASARAQVGPSPHDNAQPRQVRPRDAQPRAMPGPDAPAVSVAWTRTGHVVQLLPLDRILPHEHIDSAAAISLSGAIAQAGVVTDPLVVEVASRVLLDGHHRLDALRRLGAVRAPCVLIAYDAPGLRLDGWRAEWPVDRDRVLQAARSGRLLPVKTSRHRFDPDIGGVDIPLAWLRPPSAARGRFSTEDDRT